MFELSEIEELAKEVNFSSLFEIAKKSAQIGNEILKDILKTKVLMYLTKKTNIKRRERDSNPR